MARGKRCSCCGYHMWAQTEDRRERGTWVTYVCRNGNCRTCGGRCRHTEKVFEGN